MKYKPCCGRRCLLGNCETRESGGCYCVCRLVDHINILEQLIKREIVSPNVWFGSKEDTEKYYRENKEKCDKYIAEAPAILEEAKERLKKYEIE